MFHEHPTLFVSWRSPRTRRIHPVGRLQFDAPTHRYEFRYVRSARRAEGDGFTPFPEFPALEGTYRSTQLFPLFANRVMPASRPGYAAFLATLGLSAETGNPMAILARTGGKRATDQIEMFPLPSPADGSGCYTTLCLLRAVRYMSQPAAEERITRLKPGEQLFAMLDFQNPADRKALALRTADNVMIGYLPAYLADDVWQLCEQCDAMTVTVERVNPPPAEVHHRVLCRVVSCWPTGFQPFQGDEFQPIS